MNFSKWRKPIVNKYSQLLSALILLFLLSAVFDGFIGSVLLILGFFWVIFSLIKTFNLERKRFLLLLFIAGIGFITQLFALYKYKQNSDLNRSLWLINNIIEATFIIAAIVLTNRKIFTEKKVDFDTIKGGISIFFLIGLLWTLFYSTLYIFEPNAFSSSIETIDLFESMFYFSFTTLTTLGYGDITPTTDLARALANLQALVGILYPSVFIARLVGLYTAEEMNKGN